MGSNNRQDFKTLLLEMMHEKSTLHAFFLFGQLVMIAEKHPKMGGKVPQKWRKNISRYQQITLEELQEKGAFKKVEAATNRQLLAMLAALSVVTIDDVFGHSAFSVLYQQQEESNDHEALIDQMIGLVALSKKAKFGLPRLAEILETVITERDSA